MNSKRGNSFAVVIDLLTDNESWVFHRNVQVCMHTVLREDKQYLAE